MLFKQFSFSVFEVVIIAVLSPAHVAAGNILTPTCILPGSVITVQLCDATAAT
jgi:hypothetical protein